MRCPNCQHEFGLHVAKSSTSRAAGQGVVRAMTGWRLKLWRWLLERAQGATDEEITKGLRMNPNTERPRRVELVDMGRVVDSGRVRLTESGTKAVVWIAAIESKQGELFA